MKKLGTKTKKSAADYLPDNACAEGVAYARRFKTLAEAWGKCERSDWMFWLVRHKNLITKPQAVEIAIACAERVLTIYEKRHPNDPRPRAAVEAARKWLKEPTEENQKAAYAAYAAAAYAAYAAAAYAAAAYAAYAAAAYATYAAATAAAAAYAAYAAYAAATADDAAAAYAAERKAQADIIRKVMGNPF